MAKKDRDDKSLILRVAICVGVCLSSLRLNAAAPEMIYRMVSATGGNDSPVFRSSVVKVNDENFPGAVQWSSLPFNVWFPRPREPLDEGASFMDHVVFMDAGFPSVNSQVKVTVQKPVIFSMGEAALCVFSVRSSGQTAGTDENYSAGNDGIESVSVTGDGMFLADRKSLKVIAGRTRFSRKITYALWRADVGRRENVEEMDIAWSVVP